MSLPEFRSATTAFLQVATAGRWEEAERPLDWPDDAADKWLAKAKPDVAIEAVFSSSQGQLAGFIGFRRTLKDADARVKFWKTVLERSKFLKDSGSLGLGTAWLDILGAPVLLQSPPSSLELGVFNQWKSAGSMELETGFTIGRLKEFGPAWMRLGATAPICLERVWRQPERFWIAENVSNRVESRHYLNFTKLPELPSPTS